jgi:CO dehydrogenase maturation factor
VGKTTVAALLLRRLLAARRTPVLAVDADPSACLASTLGVGVDTTLGDLRDRLRKDPETTASMAKQDWLALMADQAIVEERGFDLLTMGHPEGPGCYCFVNNLVRDYLERLTRSYRAVIVDCEAGQEHLSRRTARKPDQLVCVASRSRMAAETIHRALGLFEALHDERPLRIDLVLNDFVRGEPLAVQAEAIAAGQGRFTFSHVWTVPRDENVEALDSRGGSIFELSGDSPALAALEGWEDGV